MSGLMAIRASSEANSAEQKRLQERKRVILVLINQHLIENGYIEAAERLQHETGGVLGKYVAADNIDMGLVLNEYESYYEMRFDKKPKLMRKLNDGEDNPAYKSSSFNKAGNRKSNSNSNNDKGKVSNNNGGSSTTIRNTSTNAQSKSNNNSEETDDMSMGVAGVSLNSNEPQKDNTKERITEERLLRPPPQFGGDADMKALANTISREIYQDSTNVQFKDIIKLDEAKRLLVEAVQLPLRFPFLFTGILRPWRGILLHGPPGTGKTLLAKAVATECHTTFFNISASTLVSKWRGDSEKLVRCLFEVARYHAPSTIFLDEIDSILTSRNGEGGEHEASRRMKTELLIQMDGVKSKSGGAEGCNPSEQVFVMAASNLPWDLDIAVLRRLEKRVLVPLPEVEARQLMFHKHLADRAAPDLDFPSLGLQTDGYSGADIELVCRESAMMPVRRLMKKVEAVDFGVDYGRGSTNTPVPPAKGQSSRGGTGKILLNKMAPNAAATADVQALLQQDPVTMDDVTVALSTTKPSSDGKITKYVAWQAEFGSV